MTTLSEGLLFLINTLFDLFLFILVIRFILAWSSAHYFDPVTQVIVRLTDFMIKPLRRFIPNIYRFETATLLVILVFELIKFETIAMLSMGAPNISGLILLSIADILKLFIQTFFYAILVQALMSWIMPNSPLNNVLYQVTSPIMRPFQRWIPLIGGVDISPIPAMIFLQLLIIIMVNPLMGLGLTLSFA